MNVPLAVGVAVFCAIALGIAIELARLRAAKRRRARVMSKAPQRSMHLEREMAPAFKGPRSAYGECFARFSIWRHFDTTRMEIWTSGPWEALNLFTRSLILRHLWLSLVTLTKTQVVISVDAGAPNAMVWNAQMNEQFKDGGVPAPWARATGRAGTLISGN
jgi:hypothetical protein